MGVRVCGAWQVRDGGVIISTHKVFGLQRTSGVFRFWFVLLVVPSITLSTHLVIMSSRIHYRVVLCVTLGRGHGDFAARDYCVSASVVLHDVRAIRADRVQGALFDRHILMMPAYRNRNAFIISLTEFSENIFPSNLCE